MSHDPVPLDVASEIHELRSAGLGMNQIGAFTGVNSSTVKRVIAGKHQSYCDKLSSRQIQRLIYVGFQPL